LYFFDYRPCIIVLTTSTGLLAITLTNPANAPAIKSAINLIGIIFAVCLDASSKTRNLIA